MVNSVGKKLQQSRLAKQLSIEEAARVTRIRPDKLLDLEEDNYSNFPSMSYAKGFLLLYARFLGVDVREFSDTLHAPNPVSSDDYEYLNAAAAGPQPQPVRRSYHFTARREHTLLPVVVFGLLAAFIGFVIYFIVSFESGVGNLDETADKKDASSPGASAAGSPLAAVAVAASPAEARPAPKAAASPFRAAAAPALRPPPAEASPAGAGQPPLPPPIPAGTFDPSREVRRAEPVLPIAPSNVAASPTDSAILSAIAPAASQDAVKQVSIMPIRKTMVTIRKDVAGSAPVFEDWLYPGDGPLKLSGHKFWIQVQDPGAVKVTQDGAPLPAGQSDIQIE